MDVLLEKWGFTKEVFNELTRCNILSIDYLLNLEEDDLAFIDLKLTANTIDRLMLRIKQHKEKNSKNQTSPTPLANHPPENIQSDSDDQENENLNKRKHRRVPSPVLDDDSDFSFNSIDPYFSPPKKKQRLNEPLDDCDKNLANKTQELSISEVSDSNEDENGEPNNIASNGCTLRNRKVILKEPLTQNINSNKNKSQSSAPKSSNAKKRVKNSIPKDKIEIPPIPITAPSALDAFCPGARLNEKNISLDALRTVIEDSIDGLVILANYKKFELLTSTERDTLCNIIINRCGPSLASPVYKFFGQVAEGINLLMPNEAIGIYFIAPHACGNKNAKGKLPDKWRNIQHKLTLAQTEDVVDCDTGEPVIEVDNHDVNFEAGKNWLKTNDFPFDEVKIHWNSTHKHRLIDLKTKTYDSIFNEEWPILKKALGPQLIDLDYYTIYPESRLALEKNWTPFFNALYQLRKSIITDPKGKRYRKLYESCLESSANNEKLELDGLRLLLLPFLIPIKRAINTPKGQVRVTYQESSDGFIIWAKGVRMVSAYLKFRAARYAKLQLKVQPVLVLVATDPNEIITCFISLHDKLWEIKKPLKALGTLFKLIILTNVEYPEDCAHIWVSIQKCVFKVTTECDQTFPESTQVINDLKVKLKL